MIVAQNIQKFYQLGTIQIRALDDVSFQIETGKVCCIMGKSGSGKSTLLRQLSLIDTPNSGSVTIDGVETAGLTEKQRSQMRLQSLGYVFQEYALIPELTAIENVGLPRMQLVGARRQTRQRAAELLEMVGLADRLKHMPKELSGGEQQRVAIARALINEPSIIFADEPTANLDSISSIAIMYLLGKLNRELGVTVVFVSHDPDQHHYAQQILNLKDGKLIEVRV